MQDNRGAGLSSRCALGRWGGGGQHTVEQRTSRGEGRVCSTHRARRVLVGEQVLEGAQKACCEVDLFTGLHQQSTLSLEAQPCPRRRSMHAQTAETHIGSKCTLWAPLALRVPALKNGSAGRLAAVQRGINVRCG